MIISIIVAATKNNVIGRDNGLIWKLSADLKHFKVLTTGHTIIMGRKTFESIGRALPNRRNIVISRNPGFQAEGCEVVGSVAAAFECTAEEKEVFVIGGGMIYREIWDMADRIYLTRVQMEAEGDTHIQPLRKEDWEVTEREDFAADEKNEHAYSFINYRRIHL